MINQQSLKAGHSGAIDIDLWIISNNTDGRGSPSPGDDRLYRVRLAPAG